MVKTLRWRVAQLFEILWWKRYLANKDVSNYLTLKKKYWNEVLEKLAESVHMTPGQHVLDAGCGPAGIFIILDGYKVTAIDPLLDTYEEKLAHFNKDMYPYVNFETTPLETFQSSERYDFVYCMNAINHVSQLKDGFKTLYDHTKTGGTLIVSIDAHNHKFFKRLFQIQPADILHPHQFDIHEYSNMLIELGCTIEQTVLIKKEFLFNHYILVAKKQG